MNHQPPQLPRLLNAVQTPALIVGVAASLLLGWGYVSNPDQFYQSYLFGYMFWLAIPLGSLALLMLQHQSGGNWGLVIRRVLEAGSRMIPLMAILFIPLLFGIHSLYHWSHPEAVAKDPILQAKVLWLNETWFIIRAAIYFLFWIVLTVLLNRWSRVEDATGDPRITRRMRILSGPGLFIYVATMTCASIDWVMSIDPHWYSTMFGLIIIIGQVLAALAFTIALMTILFQYEPLAGHVGRPQFQDLGNLLMAFILVWAYFCFSQFLIIWAGNIKEETPYYLVRTRDGLQYTALFLIVFHFFIPFLLLMWRRTKRSMPFLATLAIALVLMRFVDLHWTIKPTFLQGELTHPTGHMPPLLHWMDFVTPIAIGGIWFAVFIRQLRRLPLLPLHDPRLAEVHHGH